MNSFVSVEDQDVESEDIDSLVLSASTISGSSVEFDKKSEDNFGFENNESPNSAFEAKNSASDGFLFCMGEDQIGNRSVSDVKFGQSQCTNVDSKVESYVDCNSLEFDYLPFETVLMNYPEELDYYDLSEKYLGIDHNSEFENKYTTSETELSLFASDFDSETESFDGFSDQSNSSFEGFSENTENLSKESKGSICDNSDFKKVKSNSFTLEHYTLDENRLSRPKFSSRFRKFSQKTKYWRKNKKLKAPFISKLNKTKSIKHSHTYKNLYTRPTSTNISKEPAAEPYRLRKKRIQNYSKSIISPFYSSSDTKFKEKVNVYRTMQQKDEKENLRISSRLRSSSNYRKSERWKDYSHSQITTKASSDSGDINGSNSSIEIDYEPNYYTDSEDLFGEDLDQESFEGFINMPESLKVLSDTKETLKIKEEKTDFDDYIGKYCNDIGCTISWLESRQCKSEPQTITNGVIYELSEFAKKIAWEPNYVVDWAFRLRGYINIEVGSEDLRKVNSVLKRRKALSVNFAGHAFLKAKLASFDSEIVNFPTLDKLEYQELEKENQASHNINENIRSKASSSSYRSRMRTRHVFSKSEVNNDIPDPSVSNIRYNQTECCTNKISNTDAKNDWNNVSDLKYLKSPANTVHESSENRYVTTADIKNTFTREKDSSSYATNLVSSRIRRVRKPTTRAQESYSMIQIHSPNDSYTDSDEIISSNINLTSDQNDTPQAKLLHPIFIDDGKDIGPHCKANGITIKFLNSSCKSNHVITNGIVYELYHFFRERRASLTSLVHTLYHLKNIPVDKLHIIATMAKIHEMVKVMWEEQIKINSNMPFEEFNIGESESTLSNKKFSKAEKSSQSPVTKNYVENLPVKQKDDCLNDDIVEPLNKRRKVHCKDLNKRVSKPNDSKALEQEFNISESQSKIDVSKGSETAPLTKSFDLNATKGFTGKITRGDIVYLYTKWLKKKMEGQSNVFVTDLSKDVEELIVTRKVDFIRIPVGTLMSSSVKLFEEFRKLSKVNMLDAKAYLLEDWLDDIKVLIKSHNRRKSALEQNNEIQENIKDIANVECTANNSSVTDDSTTELSSENLKSLDGIPESSSSKNCIFTAKDSDHSLNETPALGSDAKKNKLCVDAIDGSSGDYDVEKIVGYRIVKIGEESVTEYRIRWSGFTSKDDSWINEAHLNCPDILAKFWEALNRQRALKNKKERKYSISTPIQDKIEFPTQKNIQGQENVCPFFGKSASSQNFFNLMIKNLKPELIDYQHEEEGQFMKRIKISKGEVLQIYDDWRKKNQEHLLTGGNQKVDVSVLITKVKQLMESRRVRNFNPNCIIDACYRMSLMKAKLKDPQKVHEYLCGDFVELMQCSLKHQGSIRNENSLKLKKLRILNKLVSNGKVLEKINAINNIEKESLIIARYLKENRDNENYTRDLEKKITSLKSIVQVTEEEESLIDSLKKQNAYAVKELESFGVEENTLNEILNIALKVDN